MAIKHQYILNKEEIDKNITAIKCHDHNTVDFYLMDYSLLKREEKEWYEEEIHEWDKDKWECE